MYDPQGFQSLLFIPSSEEELWALGHEVKADGHEDAGCGVHGLQSPPGVPVNAKSGKVERVREWYNCQCYHCNGRKICLLLYYL